MNPSKENAHLAVLSLTRISDALGPDARNKLSHHLIIVERFLTAAHRKLPYEKSFTKKKKV